MNTAGQPVVVDSERANCGVCGQHTCTMGSFSYRRRRRRLGYEISQGQVGYVSLQGTWTRLNKANSSHPLEFKEKERERDREIETIRAPPLLHKIYGESFLFPSPIDSDT